MRVHLVLILLGACGGGDEPIPATPLAGQLNGMPWMAGGATAEMGSDPGEKSVSIHPDVDLTCASFGDAPYVAAGMPWQAGTYGLGLDADAFVFIFHESVIHVVLDGRVELITAPTEVGAVATLRIRASFQDGDDDLFVEGEVAVQICE
jgi:hypothetical protein